MFECLIAILTGALGNLTSEALKAAIKTPRNGPRVGTASPADDEDDAPSDRPEDMESLRFLTRQRTRHRIDLAKAKWNWLILTAYHHPQHGRTDELPENWDPRAIGDQFTVADFAGSDLPHEKETGELAQSQLRSSLLHTQKKVVSHLHKAIVLLDEAIAIKSRILRVPPSPWPDQQLLPAWASFVAEASGRTFPDLPNLNSYCGFWSLWSVSDTPGGGIRRSDKRCKAILKAYASVAELACALTRSKYRQVYREALPQGLDTPHQWAIRKVASAVIKDLWTARERWIDYRIPSA